MPTDPIAQRQMGCLILLRHGQTSWNVSGRFQGQADPQLDAIGLAQATRAATELRSLRPYAVISSDLRRAAQTATLLASGCGLTVDFQPGLREQALGGWEGLTLAAAATAFPEEYRAWASGEDVRRGGGECEAEAGQRALAALRPTLQCCESGRTLVVVSHGLILRGLQRELARTFAFDQPVPVVHLGNGEWITLRARGRR